ncbi:MAG: hypothetical protein AAF333_18145 [Planctomycetota bacterium]
MIAIVGVAGAAPASGQTAYFSLQGDFDAALDRHDFHFDLTRSVPASEDIRFLTLANNGGTNAAGETVGGGGIDSVLTLADDAMNVSLSDDDGAPGPGFDSLIDPVFTLPSGSYQLNMSNLTNTAGLPWGIDVIAPADAIVFKSAAPDTTSGPGTSTTDSLSFGTTGGTAAAVVNQDGTLNLLQDLFIAPTGQAEFTNTGTTNVDGQTLVNSGGTLNANEAIGQFNANGGAFVDGGTLNAVSSQFALGASQTLEVINGGTVNLEGGFSVNSGKTYNITSSTLSVIDFLDVISGTLDVSDGADLTIDHSVGDLSLWGLTSGTATVTFRTEATGNVDEILQVGVGSTLNVQSGAQLTLETLQVGIGAGLTPGLVDLRGFEPEVSRITQTGDSTLTIGDTNGSPGEVRVSDEAEYSTGTGTTTINAGGVLTIKEAAIFTANGDLQINGGAVHHNYDPTANMGDGMFLGADGAKLNANGNVNVNGGELNVIAADFELGAGKTLTASDSAAVRFDGDYFLEGGNTINLNSGADLTVGVFMDIGTNADGGGNGTVVVDGLGSTLTIDPDGNAATTWGGGGDTGSVTVRNLATANVGSSDLYLGDSSFETPDTGSTGILNVESAAQVDVNNLFLASGTVGIAEIAVRGSGTLLQQSAMSSTVVGGTGSLATNRAILTIEDGAVFSAGGGQADGSPDDGFQVRATGTVRVLDGGTLQTTADLKNSGTILGSGIIGAPVLDNFGVVRTVGQITGQSTGVSNLRVFGDYIHREDATLEISRVTGFVLTELDVSGQADLFGGTLDFVSEDVAGEFQTLAQYDSFRILSSSSLNGQFAEITGHILGDGTAFAVLYGLGDDGASDIVFAQRALFGDADLDGFIGQADLNAVLLNFGNDAASWITGDFDGDGFVGQADLNTVLLNFGSGTPPGPLVNAIPEPGTAIALGLLGLAGAGRPRRRYLRTSRGDASTLISQNLQSSPPISE